MRLANDNIILIGMPGAGKSTAGVILAKTLGMAFIDTDLLIQAKEGRLLQTIIDQDGVAAFLKIEEAVILGLTPANTIVATGGSVIYSHDAIFHLKKRGRLIYLQLGYEEIEGRIKNMASRGIAIGGGQKLSDLYRERAPLYERAADMVVNCSSLTVEAVVGKLAGLLGN
jgi:shikimate kinase